MAGVVEGVTGHQGQALVFGLLEHRVVVLVDDPDVGNRVTVDAARRLHQHFVAEFDVLQAAEETVAVRGNAEVADTVHSGHALDPARAAVEDVLVGAVENGHLDVHVTDRQHAERRRIIGLQRRFVIANLGRIPQRVVRVPHHGQQVFAQPGILDPDQVLPRRGRRARMLHRRGGALGERGRRTGQHYCNGQVPGPRAHPMACH